MTCSRFRVMLFFSDQESAYEKFGHQISSNFEEYLAQDTPFEFPFHHMHGIYHQLKNSQAALEWGTHYDGRFFYDGSYLPVLMETASNQVVECMSTGLSHTALCQLDKHSDEQAL